MTQPIRSVTPSRAPGRRSSGPAGCGGPGFVAAGFAHRTSRAGDPHLHTHVLVANPTRGPDGRWSALDAQGLYRCRRIAGDVFQTALRNRLSALEEAELDAPERDVSIPLQRVRNRRVGLRVFDWRGTVVAMTTEALRTVKDRFSEYVDRVEREHERVVVTRNGRPAIVLISTEDLESLEETLAVLSDREALDGVREGDAAVARGDVVRGVDAVRALRSRRR